MWHDQEEQVGCWRYFCCWDIAKNSVQILLFYIVLHWQILHNSVTWFPILMGIAAKWNILKLWESGVRKWELNCVDKWLISLDHVTLYRTARQYQVCLSFLMC